MIANERRSGEVGHCGAACLDMKRLVVAVCNYKDIGGNEDGGTGGVVRVKRAEAMLRGRLGYIGHRDAP